MQEKHSNQQKSNSEGEINLLELFRVLLHGKWIITFVIALMSTIGVIYSLNLPNIYESKTLIVPSNPSTNIAGALRGYGGLAGLAGLSLPSQTDEGNALKAIKKITSLSFFKNNVLINIDLPDLMAVKSWDLKTNTLTFDENIYDMNSDTWIRDYSYSKLKIPSAQESFKVFVGEHLSLSQDEKTGFITLSIKHQSPFIAKQWVELVVDEVNNFYRQKDKTASEKAVSYLNQQISATGLSEIKQVLAELLQEETKKLTLIEANKYYVFDYIDPPVVMEKKSEPNRSLICIFSALLGGMLGILLVLLRYYIFSVKTS